MKYWRGVAMWRRKWQWRHLAHRNGGVMANGIGRSQLMANVSVKASIMAAKISTNGIIS